MGVRLPDPCLVVLVGVAGAGKSTWARRWFEPAAIVSADDLRAVVGHHRHDLRATKDATEVLELIVTKRLRRGLLTVIDSTALDPAVRTRYRDLADAAGVACHAVVVDTPERETRARNRSRPEAVPSAVVTEPAQGAAGGDRRAWRRSPSPACTACRTATTSRSCPDRSTTRRRRRGANRRIP